MCILHLALKVQSAASRAYIVYSEYEISADTAVIEIKISERGVEWQKSNRRSRQAGDWPSEMLRGGPGK